ncbi:MAG: CPBP family intramembrane glutamic endopeptidase [Gemmataceae bacterium]
MKRPVATTISLVGLLLYFFSLTAVGQDPSTDHASVTSRDDFHNKAGSLQRLSPEELDKAIEADFDAVVALNFPMGVALGVIALRTGSLALPVAIHVSLHVMTDVLS